MPQGIAIRGFAKCENLFDAAVAVGRDNQHARLTVLFEANHRVVVELALLPVIGDLKCAASIS